MVVEALNNEVEVIILASAVAVHPNGVALARRAGFPVAVLHTESPYEDEPQLEFSQSCDVTFTHEIASAERWGWHYLPHAYDPAIHKPVKPVAKRIKPLTGTCDVLILGTGWPERTKLLADIDWTGIDLRILGLWPEIQEGHPLRKFYTEGIVDNEDAPYMYNSAKICLNSHRYHPFARSLNPRAFEIAACGAFQISDYRDELRTIFGDCVPVYRNPSGLQYLVRHYLDDELGRVTMAKCAKQAVQGHTFQDRAAEMIEVIQSDLSTRPTLARMGG